MISGHFDPFTDAHLDYIFQAMNYGSYMVCVVSSDKQLEMKKGKVNIPAVGRVRILDLILTGLHLQHRAVVNMFDEDTTLVANALRWWDPDIFCRGGDKTLDTMPPGERAVCDEFGIKIVHAEFRIDRHGGNFK